MPFFLDTTYDFLDQTQPGLCWNMTISDGLNNMWTKRLTKVPTDK